MPSMFCPKCGSLLKPMREKGEAFLACSCGYTDRSSANAAIVEKAKTKQKEMSVVGDEEEKMLPLTDAECPKCHHEKAYYWMVQTRAGDEPETKFLRCEKCKHTWRDYA